MSKVRIYELAKKLSKNSKEILDELSRLGIEGKKHTSGIEEAVSEKIIKTLTRSEKPAEKAAAKAEKPAKKEEHEVHPRAGKPQKVRAGKPSAEAPVREPAPKPQPVTGATPPGEIKAPAPQEEEKAAPEIAETAIAPEATAPSGAAA